MQMKRRSVSTLPLLALIFLSVSGCMGDMESSEYYSGDSYNSVDCRQHNTNEGDQYEDVGTNPFTRTGHDPFSTFAADVDTASYGIFVRDIGHETLPDPLSVRLEEYVNYFDYDYHAPEPNSDVPFEIDIVASMHPLGRSIAQLRVGIQAENLPDTERNPANLVFLIDTSGSMSSPDKLPLVQALLLETLGVLDSNDTISIVTYAGSSGLALEPTPMSERSTIEAAIRSFTAGGSTAGAAGIELAYQQAEAGFIEGGFNHVILCTDGDFNVGISDADSLVDLIEEKRRTGVTLTAIGFGSGNLNDAMMERVTNAGNGIYTMIANHSHALRYAQEMILGSINIVAKDMKIQVEFNQEYVIAYRLLGYENRALADDDFRNDVVDAGEVGAGHRVTALYELVLAEQSIPDVEGAPPIAEGDRVEGEAEIEASELVRVKVRWKHLEATEEDPAFEHVATIGPDDIADSTENGDFLWASAIAAFAEILKNSPYADMSELDRLEEIFISQAERDRDRAEFVELFQQARTFLEN